MNIHHKSMKTISYTVWENSGVFKTQWCKIHTTIRSARDELKKAKKQVPEGDWIIRKTVTTETVMR